jgi:EpsI family protein
MIMLGFLFADFAYRSTARRAAFVALSGFVPIIANGVRAYGIILVAYLSNGQIAVEVDHILYGWLFFTIVMAGLAWSGWRFREEGSLRRRVIERAPMAGSRGRLAGVAIAGLCLIAWPRAYATLLERAPTGPAGRLVLPEAAAPWRADDATGTWRPHFPGADVVALESFRAGASRVDLFAAYYRRQTDDKKLVSAANTIAVDADGETASRSSTTLTIGGENVPVAVSRISTPNGRRVILSLYWVDERFTANAITAKLLQAKAALSGGRRESAFIALATEFTGDPEAAIVTMQDLAAHLGPLEPALAAVATR